MMCIHFQSFLLLVGCLTLGLTWEQIRTSDSRPLNLFCSRSNQFHLVLYGKPARCYPAGFQGPCPHTKILVQDPLFLNYGVCKPFKDDDLYQQISRKKREAFVAPPSIPTPDPCGACGIRPNKCPSGHIYSLVLRQCIRKGQASSK